MELLNVCIVLGMLRTPSSLDLEGASLEQLLSLKLPRKASSCFGYCATGFEHSILRLAEHEFFKAIFFEHLNQLPLGVTSMDPPTIDLLYLSSRLHSLSGREIGLRANSIATVEALESYSG